MTEDIHDTGNGRGLCLLEELLLDTGTGTKLRQYMVSAAIRSAVSAAMMRKRNYYLDIAGSFFRG